MYKVNEIGKKSNIIIQVVKSLKVSTVLTVEFEKHVWQDQNDQGW
jgi:hypothetical protein